MERKFKGCSVEKYVEDYCIVDLETTGYMVKVSEIIEISAIKVRKSKVVDTFSSLVNPGMHIPETATAVNHISDEMVKDAPGLNDIIDDFLLFVGEDIIIGYNNAAFDMNLIYDKVLALRDKTFCNDYLDILHAVRRSLKELENAKLETVSKYYGFDTTGEHRALKDCYLTKLCYDKLYENFGDIAFKRSRCYGKGQNDKDCNKIQYKEETIVLRKFQQRLEEIFAVNKELTIDQISQIRSLLNNHIDLEAVYPFNKVFECLEEEDAASEQWLNRINSILKEIVNPIKTENSKVLIGTLKNKHFCLTGEFLTGPKKEIENEIIALEGIMDKEVKKTTDYLIVGALGSKTWKTGNYGGKILKAMKWKDKGQHIEIVEEKDFVLAIRKIKKQTER